MALFFFFSTVEVASRYNLQPLLSSESTMAYTGVNSCIKNGDREGSNKTHSQGFDAERQ